MLIGRQIEQQPEQLKEFCEIESEGERSLAAFISALSLEAAFELMVALLPEQSYQHDRLQSDNDALDLDKSKLLEFIESLKFKELAKDL